MLNSFSSAFKSKTDNTNGRAWLVNMFVKPDKLYGLQVGGSTYRDKITTGGRDFGEWITSAHAVWSRETPEIIAEFANVNHENLTTPSRELLASCRPFGLKATPLTASS